MPSLVGSEMCIRDSLRTEAPQVPPAARRRADRAPRAERAPAPATLLALGAGPGDRLHAPASLTLRLTRGRPLHRRRRSEGRLQHALKRVASTAEDSPGAAATPPRLQRHPSGCALVEQGWMRSSEEAARAFVKDRG